jgi:hypothetical protein
MAPVRVPSAPGVKVTVIVQVELAVSVPPQFVAGLVLSVNSVRLLELVDGVTTIEVMLPVDAAVRVMVCVASAVARIPAPNVSEVGDTEAAVANKLTGKRHKAQNRRTANFPFRIAFLLFNRKLLIIPK